MRRVNSWSAALACTGRVLPARQKAHSSGREILLNDATLNIIVLILAFVLDFPLFSECDCPRGLIVLDVPLFPGDVSFPSSHSFCPPIVLITPLSSRSYCARPSIVLAIFIVLESSIFLTSLCYRSFYFRGLINLNFQISVVLKVLLIVTS